MPERFRGTHGKHLKNYSHAPRPRQMGEAAMDLFGISALGAEFKIEISLYPTEIINKKCAVATIIKMRT
jgi:protein-histidine pros-kinase